MTIRLRSFHVLSTLLLLSAPAPGVAQIDSLHVPMDLVVALLGGRGEGTRIMVGSLPPEMSMRIPLANATRVVGSLATGSNGTVVVEVPGDARSALDGYTAHLQEQGWTRPPTNLEERGGFQGTEAFRQNTWCGEGYWVGATSTSFDSRTYLRITYSTRQGWNVCDPPDPGDMRRRALPSGLRLPSLEPPPRARVQGGGGGMSSNSVESEVTVHASLPLDLLFEHYARQLTAAGWIPDGQATGDGVAIGRWRVQDESGSPVVGTLGIWALFAEDSFRASLRMEGPEPRP